MIVVADLHMDKVSDSILFDDTKSQILDIRNRLMEAVEAAVKDDHVLVVAGDVFNKVNPPTYIIGEFFSFLDHCQQLGVYVYIIPGNHDCGVSWANIAMLREVDLFNVFVIVDIERITVGGGFDVTFIPHLPLKRLQVIEEKYGSLEEYLNEIHPNGMDIVIGHGLVRGLDYANDIFYEAGDALTIDVSTIPDFNLMVLGHIHNHTELRGNIVYPGSPRVTNFGEVEEEKGYVRVKADGSWTWLPFECDVTPYKDIIIDLVTKDDVDLSIPMLKKVAGGAVIKLKVMARDRVQVDEPMLLRAFNKVGYVSRLEVIISKDEKADTEKAKVREHPDVLLKLHLGREKDAPLKVRQLAATIGTEIIEEVLSAE